MFKKLWRVLTALLVVVILCGDPGASYASAQEMESSQAAQESGQSAQESSQETLESSQTVREAKVQISAPAAVLMEVSTGQVIYEKNADERRSPASITKIMTMLLAMEALADGEVSLEDEVVTSEYASSMGGSQVYLAAGEIQTFDTLLKCIAVASGNDASVAVAEHISGTEEAFVALMNKRAQALGMAETHFMDCCGLSDSDEHYTSAGDVAIMSRELISRFPEIYKYTMIWMEDITHVTRQGSSVFTLSSTNKLLKWYPYTTGLKTGSTSKAKYCISATAQKDELNMIAVVMGAEDPKKRFQDAQTLLAYGFGVSDIYIDENTDVLPPYGVEGAVVDTVQLAYSQEFRYLDVTGKRLDEVEKAIHIEEPLQAPLSEGQVVGMAVYTLNGQEIGSVDIVCAEEVAQAKYPDYLFKAFQHFLLGESVVK